METELAPAPTPTETLLQCIAHKDAHRLGYGWYFFWEDLTYKNMLSVGHWPRPAKGLELIKQYTGLELRDSYPTNGQHDDYYKVTDWVRAKVASLPRLTRGQYLARLFKIGRTGGMGSAIVKAKLDVKFDTLRTPTGGYTPELLGGYVDVTVQWWSDKSMTIECEHAARDGETLYALYQWEGCEHEFAERLLGNCYHGYTCKHCGHQYSIDSGD